MRKRRLAIACRRFRKAQNLAPTGRERHAHQLPPPTRPLSNPSYDVDWNGRVAQPLGFALTSTAPRRLAN